MTAVQKALFCVLLIGALLLRLYRLEEWPFELHNDSGLYAWHAWRLVDGRYTSLYENGSFFIPLIGHAQTALWAGIFGRSTVAAIRMPAVMASLIAIGGAGVIAWQLSQRWLAVVVTMTLLAVNPVFHHYSRTPAFLDPVAMQVVAVAALLAAERHFVWALPAGAAGALSMLSYFPGRFTPVVLAWVGLLRWRSGRLRFRTLVLAAVVCLLIIAPQLWAIQRGWNWIGSMSQFCGVNATCDIPAAAHGLVGALWLPHRDRSPHYGGGALFDRVSLAGLGAAVLLLLSGDRQQRLLLPWGVVILLIGGTLVYNSPFFSRIVGALVPLTVAVGLVAARLPEGRITAGVVIVLLAFVAYADVGRSVYEWSTWRALRASQNYQSTIGRQVLRLPKGTPVAFDDVRPDQLSCALDSLKVFLQERRCSMVPTLEGGPVPEAAVFFAYPDPWPKPPGWRRTGSPM
jgi:hypothetical protein